MQIDLGRREFLSLAAGLLVNPAVARAETIALSLVKKWPTGNAVLSPLAADGGLIFYSGDTSAGAIAVAGDVSGWVLPPNPGMAFQFRPRASGKSVVFSGQRGLICCEAATGKVAWSWTPRIQAGVPLVTGSQLFLGDGHEIVALGLADGREQWRHAGVPDTLANYAPAHSGNTVLAAPGDGRLYALDASSGTLLWQLDGRERWQYLRQLRTEGGILVAGSYKEKLFGIAVEDGREMWSFNAGNFINSHHVDGGSAYLWSPTGFIYAIDVQSGARRWRHETTDYDHNSRNWGPLMAELVTEEGRLLCLDMFNMLHVLDTRDGTAVVHAGVPGNIRHAVLPLTSGALAFPSQDGEVIVTAGIGSVSPSASSD